jgi:hypothetical protein
MRIVVSLTVAGVLACLAMAVPPAHAKTCKDTITAKARSTAQVSDESRVRRARENAITNWSARARDTYGWAYRFWARSEERKVDCGGGRSSKYCTASARPCRLL